MLPTDRRLYQVSAQWADTARLLTRLMRQGASLGHRERQLVRLAAADCEMVLAALTASMVRRRQDFWKPIAVGAALSFAASIATWFIVVALIDSINAPVLHLQAATGILAIVVLAVIMNWFFHKVYWTGWISLHEKRKRAIMERPCNERSVFWGLWIVGLTGVYCEGFEVVLFLQNVRLQAGNKPVLWGAIIGVALTGVVGFLTLVAQRKLPIKQLLVATGIMIGGVLLVMVGASGQAMQLAGWLPTTPIDLPIPAWVSAWFGVYPNIEGLSAQTGSRQHHRNDFAVSHAGRAYHAQYAQYFALRAIGSRDHCAAVKGRQSALFANKYAYSRRFHAAFEQTQNLAFAGKGIE